MPIPLPRLDTRRWLDLVEEGRALLPRHAPDWTDHNVHDPGITMVELFAWLIEQGIYRLDQVTPAIRRKFLALAGIVPRPPRPALLVLALQPAPGAAPFTVPARMRFMGRAPHSTALALESRDDVLVPAAQLVQLLSFDGAVFFDLTRRWQDGLSFRPFGDEPVLVRGVTPDACPALYLGFDSPLAPAESVSLGVFVNAGEDVRAALTVELTSTCPAPLPPCKPSRRKDSWCAALDEASAAGSAPSAQATAIRHHSARLQWEYWDGTSWRRCRHGGRDIIDATRAFTLDGVVTLATDAAMVPRSLASGAPALCWVRIRMASGAFDDAPVIHYFVPNALLADQQRTVIGTLVIAPGVVPSAPLAAGQATTLDLAFDVEGRIATLGVDTPNGFPAWVVDFAAATPLATGALALDWLPAAVTDGMPEQQADLEGEFVAAGSVQIRTLDGPDTREWVLRPDLDPSGPRDAHAVLDADASRLLFGDGEHGRVPPDGAMLLARYRTTDGLGGTPGTESRLTLAVRGDPSGAGAWNGARLGQDPALFAPLFAIARHALLAPGADSETLEAAERRAAVGLWCHERLVEQAHGADTLDQLDPAAVRSLPPPPRATTPLDVERIALGVPGTVVRRARAFAGLHPELPGLDLPGLLTLVVVPALPRRRPMPSRGLLAAVRRFLEPRRVLCQQLLLVPPTYVVVTVEARFRLFTGADAARTTAAARAVLDQWLDPVVGGPAGRGWPFGRDVFRSEILQLLDEVEGVDHVLELTLSADGHAASCGNLCLPPTALTSPGDHALQVAIS